MGRKSGRRIRRDRERTMRPRRRAAVRRPPGAVPGVAARPASS